jgi:alkylation response protein AidB-like acyl-CoA dehydrogenase
VSSFDALCANGSELATLRASIRAFLAADRAKFGWQPAVDSWLSGWDEGFSVRLGDAGFIGLTIPVSYGGHGMGQLDRYVVTEELLAHGAPVAAHWTADRQLAPTVLAVGTEQQRQHLLPRIAAGRCYSAIGMSEPGAGSDLAAARTRATRINGGWVLNGAKAWTSGAHFAHQVVVLARTAPLDSAHRHDGFSQFLVATDSPGVTISPVLLMSGAHHFNEVSLAEVFVPDADVLGRVGAGWDQITAELSFERSGPDRILSTAPLITAAIRALACDPDSDDRAAQQVGELLARLISLRQLSISVARALADGQSATNQAALVKDLGTRFEQESVDLISELLADRPADPGLRQLMTQAWMCRPLFTLRGGTNEVLRGVVARGMGLR